MDTRAYEYLMGRGVTRICHFTSTVSLLHIFRSATGIMATAFLDDDIKRLNDLQRLDNETEYLNCSIEYPNTWYWKKIKDKDPVFVDWVFLFIDPSILNERQIKYSPCNAATGHGMHISSDYNQLGAMFKPTLSISRHLSRTPRMLNCCPTDDQAEILVYKNIPLHYITGIAVPNDKEANLVAARFRTISIFDTPPLYIAPDIFSGMWSDMIRIGKRPTERQYLGGEIQ